MSKKLLSTLIASLFVATPALAQSDDPIRLQGSFSIGPIYNDQNANNSAKLEEYQDLGNGVLSNVFVQGRNRTTWFDGYGENFTRDDQYLFLRGGMYDLFKYGAWSNAMPHNFTLPARTPYAGSGGDQLLATFPQTNPNAWNSFDQGYKRTDNGGFFEWQSLSPWYFRVDGNQVKFDGTKVGSAANGTSPGNGYVDLAFPVQTTTDNVGVEGGYQTRNMTLALRWDYSKFNTDNETLLWSNPYFGNRQDVTYLAPANEFNKFTATGNMRGLPWNSVLSARYTWAETKSDGDLGTGALNTGSTYQPTFPSEPHYNAKHENQSFQFSWTANPAQGVDSRVYYFWTKLDNKSDLVEYGHAPSQPLPSGLGCGTVPGLTPNTTVPGNCDNELFSYDRNNVGIDVYWRLAKGHRIGGGWDYVDMDQERFDYDSMKWNKFWVEYKNTMLPNLAARLKYTYIDREANFILYDAGTGPNPTSPEYLLRYTTAFDMQDVKSNQFKLTVDWSPMPLFDVSFEGIWKDNDYQNVTLGRTNDKRQEYYLTASYGAMDGLRATIFGDWEEIEYDSSHRNIGAGTCTAATGPNCFDPASPPNASAYNWTSGTKDQNWAVGIGVDWPVTPQLMVKGSYLYFETDGSADFQSQNNYGNPIPIDNFDNSTRQSFNLKAIYAYTKQWSFTLGYAYEKWEYDDIGYSGYQFSIPFPAVTNNTSQSYLNGYNAFTNGHQNIFYGLVTFRF